MEYSYLFQSCIENAENFATKNGIVISPELLFYALSNMKEIKDVYNFCNIDIETLTTDLVCTIHESEECSGTVYEEDAKQLLFEVEKLFISENGADTDARLTVDYLFKGACEAYPEIFEYYEGAGLDIEDDDALTGFIECFEELESFCSAVKSTLGLFMGKDENGNPYLLMGTNPVGSNLEGISSKSNKGGTEKGSQKDKPWSSFCIDLCEEVKKHPEPLVGRETEMNQTLRVLCRKEKSNVMHLGEAGVGKTAMTLGLARKLNANNVPCKLRNHKLFSLNMGSLMAGTHYRGDLEERVRCLISDLEEMGNAILYIDEIHMIVGNGNESMDVGNLLKQALLNTNIKFIGSTTFEEYRRYIEKDKALCRRFKVVELKEPTQEETKEIIGGIIDYYQDFHGVKYTDDAIDSAISLSSKYISDKFLPDKAIDLIDEAGAEVSKNRTSGGTEVVSYETITKSDIEEIISESYHIPKETVKTSEGQKILELEKSINAKVFGQNEAIKSCIDTIKLSRVGLTEPNKPIASLLFVGQTGVGKTEIVKQIASVMGIKLIRFDMSEYMDSTSVNKLIGASAGYVGYEDGGLLVEQIRKNPHCVLLLDEIEKAHPLVFNSLLQVMDNATLTDNKGRVADFKNVLLIMTSNAGADNVMKKGLGFGQSSSYVDDSAMDSAVEKTFTPEFRNRLTRIIKLNPMSDEMADKIVDKYLTQFADIMLTKGIKVTYADDVHTFIKERGVTKEFGARPIIKAVDEYIKMLFVDKLLTGELKDGSECRISVGGSKLVLE